MTMSTIFHAVFPARTRRPGHIAPAVTLRTLRAVVTRPGTAWLRTLVTVAAVSVLPVLPAAEPYAFKATTDHQVQPGVPQGKVIQMPTWESKIFPNTTRDWWVYVPANYKPDGSAALMVFQDGRNYINPTGNFRAPIVFDNLIARGEMPVTLAVFVMPGHQKDAAPPKKGASASNRGLEYNALGDRYARFLLEEILPEVAKQYPFSNDPEKRAIAGSSSGAIAAFTVAWERPDQFRKIFSTVGSFVNLRGGHDYPALIRKTERKPLRVYLQDTSGDNDNTYGHWPTANKLMHAALRYMGYDVHLEWAEGYGHNSIHGGMVFPAAMRWLWREERHVPKIDTKHDLAGDMTLHRLLIEGEAWQVAAEGMTFSDAACTDAAGNFYFSDVRAGGIYRLEADGTKKRVSDEAASGLKFGPDGRLYGCLGAKKHIFAVDLRDGAVETIASDVQPNDFVITERGHIYFTETAKRQVSFVDVKTKVVRVADTGLAGPNGIALSPDHGTVAVSESGGQHVWAYRINGDGTLDARLPYMTLRRPIDPKGEFKSQELPPYLPRSSGDGMTTDTLGRYYVTSAVGVQVFDPTGRLCGVVAKPVADKSITSVVLAGPKRDVLYVTSGDRIFRRKVQATGSPIGAALKN
jgi:enterochelin esterase family protein